MIINKLKALGCTLLDAPKIELLCEASKLKDPKAA